MGRPPASTCRSSIAKPGIRSGLLPRPASAAPARRGDRLLEADSAGPPRRRLPAPSRPIDAASGSGLALPLPELLEDLALFGVLGRTLGGFDPRGVVSLLSP